MFFVFFFKQKTVYEMRISDWMSDVCSSDLERRLAALSKTTVQRWRKIAPTVLEFWTIERGRIWQKRLMKEWLYVREKSKKARAAVSMRKDRRGYERNTNVGTNDLHLGGGGGEGEGVLSGNRELVSR